MAMASASAQRSEPSKPMDPSPSKLATDTANDSSLSSPTSTSNGCETPGRSEQSIFSPDPRKDIVDVKSPAELRSEEYRQLFRLPAEEVLIEDFNCAFQENILIQGHMYLFVHFICFYSNIFGFETKKIIPFHEVTTVRRAKTAGIFPNAIEVHAIDKKYFFASFLSRDEAFKIINDGWTQHGNGAKAITERQEPISDSVSQEYGFVAIEKVKGSKGPDNESRSTDMNKDSPTFEDLGLPSNVQDDPVLTTVPEQQISVEQGEESVLHETSRQSWIWKEENIDAPNVPEFYTSVAESRFSIRVEDFFRYFFSDDDVNFNESYHKRCGDKDFKCTTWHPHEKFGYAREVSFNHPIKIYLGAKLGGCQEVQKFRVYRNSHLVIETSQEVSDVPYADYFRVEGLWDIQRDTDESKECCILRIYVNVAFSKKTIWKGKIVQSTVEECRDAYAIWIGMAHELLKKQKSQEKQEGAVTSACVVQKGEVHLEREANGGESSERMHESSNATRTPHVSETVDIDQRVGNLLQGNLTDTTPVASLLREFMMKLRSCLKSQSHLSLLLVIIFALIFLMQQFSILVLLARPQQIHVSPLADYASKMDYKVGGSSSEATAWLEKRMHHLKDEMYMVETRLERMRYEHALLKKQLKDLEHR